MTMRFDPRSPSIVVDVDLVGPLRKVSAKLLLDTGASGTMIRSHYLTAVGYHITADTPRRPFRSATGGGRAAMVTVAALVALDRVKTNYPVFVYDPPPTVIIDGLLGLDFFRGFILTLDFARGAISLSLLKRWWQFWR
ncbi:MAG: retroviral-like aspartic protease family protein [Planctomycetia bacterium]|nr:retroviral-like aspartic protease family protein [Planctomycetia bacterium]